MKIIGDLVFYGANIPEKPIDGLAKGYDDELIRGYGKTACSIGRG